MWINIQKKIIMNFCVGLFFVQIKAGNVTIDVHGQENIPKQDGFMFFPNHQGLYDVLAIVEACTHPFSVVAKKEVENVPIFKTGI